MGQPPVVLDPAQTLNLDLRMSKTTRRRLSLTLTSSLPTVPPHERTGGQGALRRQEGGQRD